MDENLSIDTERVDDIPLLLAQSQRMGIQELFDQHFPAHGNWQGLSPGATLSTWLAHILSEGDHRLNHVQPWAANRLQCLSASLGQTVQALDFSDDRLAKLLDDLGQDPGWVQYEKALNQRLLRVYDLRPERVRLDTTMASGYWQVSEEGLFQYGYTKENKATNQPHLKVLLADLDPLGLPLVTQVVAGNRADDPLYIPAIREVRQSLGQTGLLYVGDSKMPARETRAFIQAGGDYYLGPLSKTQLPAAELFALLQPVWQGQQALTPLFRATTAGEREEIAAGFEIQAPMQEMLAGQWVTWTERRLLVRSHGHLDGELKDLQRKLARAREEVEKVTVYKPTKKRYVQVEPLAEKVQGILNRYGVADLFQVEYRRQAWGEADKTPKQEAYQVYLQENAAALAARQQSLGWRAYASNSPAASLSLEQAVQVYRDEYIVESSFGRLKGKPLSLSPLYLQHEQRVKGLVRLLSLGLRLLSLLEFAVRRKLAQQGEPLQGLYAGNPKRSTSRPTSEALLKAFKEITWTRVRWNQQETVHITPLSEVQKKILELLEFAPSLYTALDPILPKPP